MIHLRTQNLASPNPQMQRPNTSQQYRMPPDSSFLAGHVAVKIESDQFNSCAVRSLLSCQSAQPVPEMSTINQHVAPHAPHSGCYADNRSLSAPINYVMCFPLRGVVG